MSKSLWTTTLRIPTIEKSTCKRRNVRQDSFIHLHNTTELSPAHFLLFLLEKGEKVSIHTTIFEDVG